MNKIYKFDEQELEHEDLEELERVLLRGWGRLYPETEVVIVSLPKYDPVERKRILDKLTEVYTGDDFEAYCMKQKRKNTEKMKNNA